MHPASVIKDMFSVYKKHFVNRVDTFAALMFCFLYAMVPMLVEEMYPFTRATMFANAPKQFTQFEIIAPDGTFLQTRNFGLQLNYSGDPPIVRRSATGFGIKLPSTINHIDKSVSREHVVQQLELRLIDYPELRHVDVVQTLFGAIDSSGVGEIDVQRFRVINPSKKP